MKEHNDPFDFFKDLALNAAKQSLQKAVDEKCRAVAVMMMTGTQDFFVWNVAEAYCPTRDAMISLFTMPCALA